MSGMDKVSLVVIDDEPAVLKGTCRLLKMQGYDVHGAQTGKSGLQLVKEIRPDLVLCDVMLPDMSGLDVCRHIKSDNELTGTLVVLTSGVMVSSDNKIQGLEVGADGYIPRPIPNRELVARVEALLRIKSPAIKSVDTLNIDHEQKSSIIAFKGCDSQLHVNELTDASDSLAPSLDGAGSGLRVVGIGASAGGLEALEKLFENMPPDSGLAFVVVQHLSPDYKSLMVELLSKMTLMSVHRIVDGIGLEPDSIYLIPPRKNLKILNDRLYLEEMEPDSVVHLPIDYFFRSLAENKRDKAIGIVLSGTGSDGMRGVRAIKENDGMVMAQDPVTAKFDGMPQSAISTGLVDYILPPEEMPRELIGFVRYPGLKKVSSPTRSSDEDDLSRILDQVKEHSKVDFAFYRPSTIVRRIERRMQVNQLESMQDYLQYLSGSERENNLLYKELLIGVTKFFRDREAYEIVRKNIVPTLLDMKYLSGEEIRIWVAGCSTGEEPYSIAMMFHEEMEDAQKSLPVKIFATDIDRGALEFAGEGVYPESIALDVNPERLQRFFIKSGDNYRIDRQIREMVVFASHNLINDPPFTRMDLVSCRNLLIYLQPVLQRRVLSNFAFSLNSKGFLVLGSSETVGDLVDHFSSIDNKWKIYRHRGGPKPHLDYPATLSNRLTSHISGSPGIELNPGASRQDRIFEQIYNQLIEGYGLRCIVVNEQGVLLYTFGDVSDLLNFRVGAANLQIQNLIRSELSIALGTALHRFRKEAKEIVYSGIPLDQSGESRKVNIRIRPSSVRKDNSRLIFVFIEESNATTAIGTNFTSGTIDSQTQERIVDLERELGYSRENLQSTVEELETSNEELQATNEELLASNEELQSTNEELHSVNEELHTVNTEYQGKIQELIELGNDLDNLLLHTSLGIVFLDENLKIRRFTEACKNYINLRDLDLGRPIGELSHVLAYPDFNDDLKMVLNSKTSIKKTVRLLDGGHSFVRILPYRKGQSHLDGVVVVFVDTSDLVEKEAALRRTEDWADAVTELLDAFVISVKLISDGSSRICFASKATAQTLGYSMDELINMSLVELGSDELVRIVREALANDALRGTVTLTRKDRTTINMRFRAKRNHKLGESLTHIVFFPVSDLDGSQFYAR